MSPNKTHHQRRPSQVPLGTSGLLRPAIDKTYPLTPKRPPPGLPEARCFASAPLDTADCPHDQRHHPTRLR
jgi:hypothetical protein